MPERSSLIVGLEIGTSKVCAVVGEGASGRSGGQPVAVTGAEVGNAVDDGPISERQGGPEIVGGEGGRRALPIGNGVGEGIPWSQ